MRKNIAVYTAIFGNYDNLKEPIHLNILDQADFFCFTDNERLTSNVYQIKILDKVHTDPVRCARYCKINSHLLLAEYELTIWVDANMRIITKDVTEFINDNLKTAPISILKHNLRNCIYKEAEDCILAGSDDPLGINRQMERYRKEGFPEQAGLVASNILIRKNLDEKVKEFNSLWWQELQKGSRRDQLSFDYIRWKTAIKIDTIKGNWYKNSFAFRESHEKKYSKGSKSLNRIKIANRMLTSNLFPPILLKLFNFIFDSRYRLARKLEKKEQALKRLSSEQVNEIEFLGKTFKVLNVSEFLIQKSAIFDKNSLKFSAKHDAPTIIDCNPDFGLSIIYFFKNYPSARIIVPLRADLKASLLRENLKEYSIDNVQLIDEQIRIKEENERSFFQTNIVSFLKQFLNQEIDFLKLGISSLDVLALEDCRPLLRNVSNLYLEYSSLVISEQRLGLLFTILEEAGFRLHVSVIEQMTHVPLIYLNSKNGLDMKLRIYGFREEK